MYKCHIILVVCFFYFLGEQTKAQNKYAVIVGVNEYYTAPGILSDHSLKGCVNDALTMKSLLIDKFSFNKENTTVLLNANATQANTANALLQVLGKADAGDAVVFYFCGHGIYMKNSANLNDAVKGGYNQAIVMSDLYAKDYSFLMKDNTLKKIFNQFVAKKIILTTIFDCCFSGSLAMGTVTSFHNPYCDSTQPNAKGTGKSLDFDELDTADRAFSIDKVLSIIDTSKIARPSETKNSAFASISAASQYEIAQEINDEADIKHGAFTRAIVQIYENRSMDISLPEALKMITTQLNKQGYAQTPTYRVEDLRLAKNLIGLPIKSLATVNARCISRTGFIATFDVGLNNNVGIGNIFTNKNINITITKVYPNRAEAIIKPGIKVKEGDIFYLKDSHKVSKPLIKLFIPTVNYTWAEFNVILNRSILPFTKVTSYRNYYNWDAGQGDNIYQFKSEVDAKAKLATLAKQPYFYVFSGIPSDMAIGLKRVLQKDQNIQLVNNADSASYVLYLNPVMGGKKLNYVLTYRPKITNQKKDITFCIYKNDINFTNLSPSNLNGLGKELATTAHNIIRKKSTHWLNGYAKNN